MLLPGPEAQQLATYLGWLLHRTVGGLAAGLLFVLPALILLLGLAWGYMHWRHAPWLAVVFGRGVLGAGGFDLLALLLALAAGLALWRGLAVTTVLAVVALLGLVLATR